MWVIIGSIYILLPWKQLKRKNSQVSFLLHQSIYLTVTETRTSRAGKEQGAVRRAGGWFPSKLRPQQPPPAGRALAGIIKRPNPCVLSLLVLRPTKSSLQPSHATQSITKRSACMAVVVVSDTYTALCMHALACFMKMRYMHACSLTWNKDDWWLQLPTGQRIEMKILHQTRLVVLRFVLHIQDWPASVVLLDS